MAVNGYISIQGKDFWTPWLLQCAIASRNQSRPGHSNAWNHSILVFMIIYLGLSCATASYNITEDCMGHSTRVDGWTKSDCNRFSRGPCTAARWEMGPVCEYSMKNTNEMWFFKLGMMPVKAVELLWFIEKERLKCNILLLYFSG